MFKCDDNAAKSFNIPAISLILYNYFDGPNKIIFRSVFKLNFYIF